MTDEQFATLMKALKEINENVKLITAYDAGKDSSGKSNYNLSDLHSAIGHVATEISSLEKR